VLCCGTGGRTGGQVLARTAGLTVSGAQPPAVARFPGMCLFIGYYTRKYAQQIGNLENAAHHCLHGAAVVVGCLPGACVDGGAGDVM
jgi:hypothetical protein